MRNLFWASFLVLMLALTGCAVFDALTGTDDPKVLDGTELSTVEKTGEELEDLLPFPFNIIAAAGLGYGAKAYREVRKKQKETEALA